MGFGGWFHLHATLSQDLNQSRQVDACGFFVDREGEVFLLKLLPDREAVAVAPTGCAVDVESVRARLALALTLRDAADGFAAERSVAIATREADRVERCVGIDEMLEIDAGEVHITSFVISGSPWRQSGLTPRLFLAREVGDDG